MPGETTATYERPESIYIKGESLKIGDKVDLKIKDGFLYRKIVALHKADNPFVIVEVEIPNCPSISYKVFADGTDESGNEIFSCKR